MFLLLPPSCLHVNVNTRSTLTCPSPILLPLYILNFWNIVRLSTSEDVLRVRRCRVTPHCPTALVTPGSTGPDGSLFKGVVVHFNGHFPAPVSTLRELLVSRGGIVEAYNTSRCTHMICEVLPAAKIRELRKVSI